MILTVLGIFVVATILLTIWALVKNQFQALAVAVLLLTLIVILALFGAGKLGFLWMPI